MKKRYFLFGFLALELLALPLSLPAAAQVIHKISFTAAPHVSSAQVPSKQDGLVQYVIASNTPFAIVSSGTIGEFDVSLREQGRLNTLTYGHNAQIPGPVNNCAQTLGANKTVIYTSERRTALRRGDVISQSILAEIKYAPDFNPRFEIITAEEAELITRAGVCDSVKTNS